MNTSLAQWELMDGDTAEHWALAFMTSILEKRDCVHLSFHLKFLLSAYYEQGIIASNTVQDSWTLELSGGDKKYPRVYM